MTISVEEFISQIRGLRYQAPVENYRRLREAGQGAEANALKGRMPGINTEDFSAAVDFLSLCEDVDPKRIGILGICGWGGKIITATTRRIVDITNVHLTQTTLHQHFRSSMHAY